MSLPNKIKNRESIDPKLAVGSSLSNPKELFAMLFSLYIINDEKDYLEFADINGNVIQIKSPLIDLLKDFLEEVPEFNSLKINELRDSSPLVTMQIEPLQVSLQVYWKLAKINILDSSSSSKERTGLNRYPKSLSFTTNLDLLKAILSNENGEISIKGKSLIYNWLLNEPVAEDFSSLEEKLKKALLIFTEDTLFKTWENANDEILFQQEGIYDNINLVTDIVDLNGAKEIKGTLRNLKSIVSKGIHPYLNSINRGDDVKPIDIPRFTAFSLYKKRVTNFLDLVPKSITIKQELIILDPEDEIIDPTTEYQIIFFGSPGTGKSREVKRLTTGMKSSRITFHPETDYQSFVGSYKPVMDGDKIVYDFVPQAFTNAYCNAWLNPNEPYFLIIEEINRGNCAQIFGDIFQCLDRDEDGQSEYEVNCDKDLAKYLKTKFEKDATTEIIEEYKSIIDTDDYDKIILPSNLYIYATMNTSDQSLFPMDSAFKRRWDMKFIPIDYDDANTLIIKLTDGTQYNWGNFISIINPKIKELTGSEDKQLGNRFINPSDSKITFDQFRSKILYYLWSEIYKDEVDSLNSIFKYQILENDPIEFQFGELFDDKNKKITPINLLKGFMHFNGIQEINIPENAQVEQVE